MNSTSPCPKSVAPSPRPDTAVTRTRTPALVSRAPQDSAGPLPLHLFLLLAGLDLGFCCVNIVALLVHGSPLHRLPSPLMAGSQTKQGKVSDWGFPLPRRPMPCCGPSSGPCSHPACPIGSSFAEVGNTTGVQALHPEGGGTSHQRCGSLYCCGAQTLTQSSGTPRGLGFRSVLTLLPMTSTCCLRLPSATASYRPVVFNLPSSTFNTVPRVVVTPPTIK